MLLVEGADPRVRLALMPRLAAQALLKGRSMHY